MEANRSKNEMAKLLGINVQKVNYLNLEKIKEFIDKRPQFNYFYIADKEMVNSFLAKRPGKTLGDFGLKAHAKCCEQLSPMYLGFSRLSAHMKEVNNRNYDTNKKLTADNQMVGSKKNSIAFKFSEALQEMKKEGVTDDIYHYWYPITQ
jgi:Ni,Fe-hydrogenase I large subunit